jgi:hypothetical protein
MKRALRHQSRGQAVTETALMAPLFLLGLFGVFWSIRDASLAERVQLGVRYAGVSQQLSNPYAAFSLYSVYAAIDNSSPSGSVTCINGNATSVTGDPANGIAQLPPFFQPLSTPSPLITPCPTSGAGTIGFFTGTSGNENLLPNDFITLQAQAPTSSTASKWFANKVFGGATGTMTVATENFFHSPDVGTIVRCTTLGAAVKASLEAPVSSSAAYPATISTAMPTTVTASALVPTSTTASCQNPNQTLFAAPVSPY